MSTIKLKGNPIETSGSLPKIGDKAPNFTLTTTEMGSKTLADYKGSRVILNIFPSVDTGTCAQSVRSFNKEASEIENTKVLCVSKDLPFAQARFCGAEGLKNVEMLSAFKNDDFGKDYGLNMTSGPLETLLSRCVIVLDENGAVKYTEQVSDIVDEPNYKAALNSL